MPYTVTISLTPELLILEPNVFGDARAFHFYRFSAHGFVKGDGLSDYSIIGNWIRGRSVLAERKHSPFRATSCSACGYLALSEPTDFLHKSIEDFAPERKSFIAWNDQVRGVTWPKEIAMLAKDREDRHLALTKVDA